jgi:exonuclease SbcC
MIPIRLEMTNFMSYLGFHQLDFTGFHTASIVGPNGSGKSAILDAITWVLYGEARKPKISKGYSKNQARDELITNGTDYCEVTFEFDMEGKRYLVNRRVDRGKTGQGIQFKLLTDSGELDLHGKGSSDVEIEKELGVSYEVFIASSFITQGDSSRFMDADKNERIKILKEILELDVYDKCLETASELLKESKKNRERLEEKQKEHSEKSLQVPEHERKLNQAKTELDQSNTLLDKAKAEVLRLSAEISEIDGKLKNLQDDASNLEKLSNQKEQLQSDKQKWQTEIEKCEAFISKESEIEAGFSKFKIAKAELDSLNEKAIMHGKLEGQANNLQTQIKNEQSRLEEKLKALNEDLSESHKAQYQISKLEEMLKQAQNQKQELERIEKVLGELELAKASQTKDFDNARSSYDQLSKKLAGKLSLLGFADYSYAKSALDAVPTLARQANDLLLKIESETENSADIALELEKLKAENAHLADELKMLEEGETGNCPLCGQSLDSKNRDELLAEKTSVMASVSERSKYLKIELENLQSSIKIDRQTLAGLQKQLEKKPDLEQAIAIETEMSASKTVYDQASKNLSEIAAEYENFKSRNQELLSQKKQIDDNIVKVNSTLELAKSKADKVESLSDETANIVKTLETKSFALDARKNKEDIDREMEKLAFDTSMLINARQNYDLLEQFETQKKNLDLAKTGLVSAKSALEQTSSRIESISEQAKQLEEKLVSLPELQAGKKNVSVLLEFAKSEEQAASANRDTTLKTKTNLERDLEDASKAKQQLEEVSQKLIENEKEIKIYDECKKMFGPEGIPSHILEGVIPELEEIANQILMDISQGRIGTEGMRIEVRTTREGSQNKVYKALDIILTDGQVRRPYELFSGGERFRADFAVRIALSQLLAQRSGKRLRTLVIDEGFGTQDDEGIRRLIEAIQDVSEKFDKVLVISHVDEIKNAFEKRIVVRRNAETSSFELV